MRKLLVAILAAIAIFFAAIFVASERGGEVVRLHSTDAAGEAHETPLWIVEIDGALFLRAGNPESGWLARLRLTPEVTLERRGQERPYRAVPQPEMSARVDAAMAEKYGLADRLVGVIRPEGGSVAVRLDPVVDAPPAVGGGGP